MRSARTPGSRRTGYTLVLVALLALAPGAAHALSVPFSFEFDKGVEGDFGTVSVVEDGSGGLYFEITLGSDLGPKADLHFFYFNLLDDDDDDLEDLEISSTDPAGRKYELEEEPHVRGGAGSEFDWGVSFGNGAGYRGNHQLSFASFTVSSDEAPLSLGDLSEISRTSKGLEANFAAHVQDTSTKGGSETIGALIPEPTSALLLGLGLLGLGVAGRRAS